MKTRIIFTLFIFAAIAACGGQTTLTNEPGTKLSKKEREDTFFDTARFIMTKEERKLYKHLPDKESRKIFIEDFWAKRDPNPTTPENENKEEFEARIEYANKWFRDRPNGRGWDSERGRILLQLGLPTSRQTHVRTVPGTTYMYKTDIWLYLQYQLQLVFVDRHGTGQFKLLRWPPELLSALNRAGYMLNTPKSGKLDQSFRFTVSFVRSQGQLQIKIPLKAVSFEEKNARMYARFNIEIFVYRDYRKIEKITRTATFDKSQEQLLKLKFIDLSVPFTPTLKGKYHLDVVIKEPASGTKYRNFHRFKL